MASVTGEILKLTIFGQSHSEALGFVLDGLPAGTPVEPGKLQAFMDRRAPGRQGTTARKESDRPRFLSGLVDNRTCGAPLCAILENSDVRSGDYEQLRDCPRPSHADFAAYEKFGKYHDIRGGGHFSGRLTAALCAAGGVCLQALAMRGIHIGAHIRSVGEIEDYPFDPQGMDGALLDGLGADPFPVLDAAARENMLNAIHAAGSAGDSLGGSVEVICQGVPAGLGEPIFGGVENRLSQMFFAIPAVKAVEFGDGKGFSALRGSEANDSFCVDEKGEIRTRTNRCGGILGGITNGMPVLARLTFKPTPSIALAQQSVRLSTRDACLLAVGGRHDPCIVARAVPCAEAAAAIALLDLLLARDAEKTFMKSIEETRGI